MNEFTIRRAFNGGWVLSVGSMHSGDLLPFHAFSSTEDLLSALPRLLVSPNQPEHGGLQRVFDHANVAFQEKC